MELYIDGLQCTPRPGQTLLELIRENGQDVGYLSGRPLAAKIAGEVFNLNYIPIRIADVCQDRMSIRRAMAASGGKVQLLRYSDPSGKDVYARTAQFVLFLAMWQLWPEARAKMNCTVGPALFVEVFRANDFSVSKLKEKVAELVEMDIPLRRRRITTQDAIAQFRSLGCDDKARLLSWREESYFDV